jgi:hypothetical protein
MQLNESISGLSDSIFDNIDDLPFYGTYVRDTETLTKSSGLMVFAAILFIIANAPIHFCIQDISHLRNGILHWLASGGSIPI